VGERTAAISEALHCHCPIILLPHSGFAYLPVFSSCGGYGVVFGFDRARLEHATATAPKFPAHYLAMSGDVDIMVLEFLSDCARHFGLPNPLA
jgi:hypothetical protein